MENRKIVFFDGNCSFCNSLVDLIWKYNSKKNIYYASLQSEYAKQFLLNKGIKNIDFNTIYFYEGDNLSTKSRAVLNIVNYLDGLYPIFYKISFIIPKVIADYCYDFIAQNRYTIFGQDDTCRIPNKEEEKVFLDI
tara:strand:+ start:88 stop:495 length:408 start_codon:yes stop_codon:yes gene_type:complete